MKKKLLQKFPLAHLALETCSFIRVFDFLPAWHESNNVPEANVTTQQFLRLKLKV